MNNILFAFDLDGVLFDFEKRFCQRFGTKNRHMYDLVERFKNEGFSDDIVQFVKNPDTYFALEPIFGGMKFLREVVEQGFRVIYLTGRDMSSIEQTRNALNFYNLPSGELIFSKNKSDTLVLGFYEYDVKVLVDDSPIILRTLPEEVVGLCWGQPWNIGVYPRVRYNELDMRVEISIDTVSDWKGIWEI